MSGGTVVVSGPTMNGNGSLDSNGGITVAGGTIAAGSSGMAEAPGPESAQGWLQVNFSPTVAAGETLSIVSDGKVIASFTTTKEVANLVFAGDGITLGAATRSISAARSPPRRPGRSHSVGRPTVRRASDPSPRAKRRFRDGWAPMTVTIREARMRPTPEPEKPRSTVSRRAMLGGSFAALLGVGGAAGGWAANRYLIDHVEVTNASQQTSTAIEAVQAASTGTSTATTYRSDTATIAIEKVVTGSGATP